MDLIQLFANAVNNVTAVGIKLVIALGSIGGLVMLMFYLGNVAHKNKRGQHIDGPGKFWAIILLCCCVISLTNVMNKTAHQMGLNDVQFGAIAYVSQAKYGEAAIAANAALTLCQLIGAAFALKGLSRLRRSLKDGHTGLSAGEDISSGVKHLICGVLLIDGPQVLDILQNTLQVHW